MAVPKKSVICEGNPRNENVFIRQVEEMVKRFPLKPIWLNKKQPKEAKRRETHQKKRITQISIFQLGIIFFPGIYLWKVKFHSILYVMCVGGKSWKRHSVSSAFGTFNAIHQLQFSDVFKTQKHKFSLLIHQKYIQQHEWLENCKPKYAQKIAPAGKQVTCVRAIDESWQIAGKTPQKRTNLLKCCRIRMCCGCNSFLSHCFLSCIVTTLSFAFSMVRKRFTWNG